MSLSFSFNLRLPCEARYFRAKQGVSSEAGGKRFLVTYQPSAAGTSAATSHISHFTSYGYSPIASDAEMTEMVSESGNDRVPG